MELGALAGFWNDLPVGILVFVRIASFFAAAPLLGGSWMPFTARALLCFSLTLLATPVAADVAGPLVPDLRFLALAALEAMAGLCFGWLLGLAVQGVRMGGDLINRYAGFQAAENFDPGADIGEGPFGDLMHIALVFVILATGTHLAMLAGLVDSFRILPVGAWAMPAAGADLIVHQVDHMNRIALALSMPVLAAVMAITVAEGVLVRSVPQINVLHISFAIKIGVSVIVMSAVMPAVVAFLGVVAHGIQGLSATAAGAFTG
jgi:flagellar biosynthesis protein FliR